VPDIHGTIPAIKKRPKVAKRSTIVAPIAPEVKERPKAARPPAVPSPAVHAPAVPTPAPVDPVVKERSNAAKRPAAALPTIPPVKDRPKVAKRSTIVAPNLSAKKPLVKKTAGSGPVQAQPLSWISWAPLAVGIGLGFVAPQVHALAALWDPWGSRLLFPFVQLPSPREIGMSDELTRTLPQLMLYFQFPLEGLLVASNLRRGMRFSKAFAPIPALHFLTGLVLWIVALGSAQPI
jgi:hypothetical protein